MIGEKPTIPGIDLELEQLVLPDNLLCKEEQDLYRVDTCCNHCNCRIRVVVVATGSAIALFQQLLFAQLSFLCPRCSRETSNHGRSC
ncbi:E7 [Gammapapillomavirus sp.]|uniref:E7 n=1 Tax=Gammapapillomavirus sp. TaxID=2049444 RepID=UPI000C5CAA52|nr:E7 [Gammapapillomavirus sp.]ATQ38616.1 E7 [Gammapapillomavirus sp.]